MRSLFSTSVLLTTIAASTTICNAFTAPSSPTTVARGSFAINPIVPYASSLFKPYVASVATNSLLNSRHCQQRQRQRQQRRLSQSSGDNQDNNDDSNNTINIALAMPTSPNTNNGAGDENKEIFRQALLTHPFCKMTGIQLSIIDLPCPTKSDGWSKDTIASLQNSDIACFSTSKSVKTYLQNMDLHLDIPSDTSEKDKKGLPNIPTNEEGSAGVGNVGIMAACINTETAKECLNSGRWMSNHIYYPKTAEVVDLKIEEENDYGEDSDDDDDDFFRGGTVSEENLEQWTASVMQAAGDVMERKFWGGGW